MIGQAKDQIAKGFNDLTETLKKATKTDADQAGSS